MTSDVATPSAVEEAQARLADIQQRREADETMLGKLEHDLVELQSQKSERLQDCSLRIDSPELASVRASIADLQEQIGDRRERLRALADAQEAAVRALANAESEERSQQAERFETDAKTRLAAAKENARALAAEIESIARLFDSANALRGTSWAVRADLYQYAVGVRHLDTFS